MGKRDVRDTLSKRLARSRYRRILGAHENVHFDEAVVDADAVKSLDCLGRMVRLVEDDHGASQASSGRSILYENLLGLTDIDGSSEVILNGH